MILERIVSAGIAHNSYLVGADAEAAVIDPRRDCQVYLDAAAEHELRIKYVFETHRHEDFVTGSRDLANLTGAEVYHGPGLDWKFGRTLVDDQEFRIGNLALRALHTPGHTDESMSYTVGPARGGAVLAVFSGDALFAGDVGRTDLCGEAEGPRLASALFDSVFSRLLPLGDGVILYPAHGAGSVCGRRIADRDYTTIGTEKKLNPLLRLTREAFLARKAAEGLERPPYFRQMEKYNLDGPPPGRSAPAPLGAGDFKSLVEAGAQMVDTREPPAFGGAHIKGSYSMWLEGVPGFAGWFLDYDRPIALVLEDSSYLRRAVNYLGRLGFDRVTGYLAGGMESWYNAGLEVESLSLLSVHDLKRRLDAGEDLAVLDVREDDEWRAGHVSGARNIFVGELEARVAEVDRGKPVAAFCTVGHRAGLGASILLRSGHPRVHSVLGSWEAWRAAGFPTVKE
jgi:hydroxyacylglutathione hydrolase